jgi:hypothetical protein
MNLWWHVSNVPLLHGHVEKRAPTVGTTFPQRNTPRSLDVKTLKHGDGRPTVYRMSICIRHHVLRRTRTSSAGRRGSCTCDSRPWRTRHSAGRGSQNDAIPLGRPHGLVDDTFRPDPRRPFGIGLAGEGRRALRHVANASIDQRNRIAANDGAAGPRVARPPARTLRPSGNGTRATARRAPRFLHLAP